MSNIKRILTAAQEAREDATDWVIASYFSHLPANAQEDYDGFLERFENGEEPDAELWEPFENYAESQVVEWIEQAIDSLTQLLLRRSGVSEVTE